MTSLRVLFPRASSVGVIALLLSFLTIIQPVWAQTNNLYLPDNRQPALFTQEFGSCLNSSIMDITRFDAAYYQDNMTVSFNIEGTTSVTGLSVMMYIGVFAYGESRFNLIFDPCGNINSLCPTNTSVPTKAYGAIPVAPSDVAGIPPIALQIPDFEGQAILRIFDNGTQSEIACVSAAVVNGNSFSQPAAVGSVLGIFTLVGFMASLATAIHGDHIPTIRTHYAHSALSMFVIFSVLHHVFFSGALSMNWPSVLPAWWSNFAWSVGMIHTDSMQASINSFIGNNRGNTTAIGGAATGSSSDHTGGGSPISQIYKRAIQLVEPGLPLPGNYSSFAGTLSAEDIPASNAFMTGFLWFLVLILLVAGILTSLKGALEVMSNTNLVKKDRLSFFRKHWQRYTAMALLRTMFIGFFMMIFLTLFQFIYKGPAGVTAIAAIVFLVFFVGMFGITGYACFYRLRYGSYLSSPDKIHIERSQNFPLFGFSRESSRKEKAVPNPSMGSLPWWKISYVNEDPQRAEVHEDEQFNMRFAWLSARFRRTKWWFFSYWLVYEFVRACFYGAGAGQPMLQVFGLLIVEILAFIFVISTKPFEANRLNALMVYMLGLSKVATLALSAAFDARFNLPRIITTAIGIIIIVIQGLLVLGMMILIVIGVISSYMSMTRNRESFYPKSWISIRERYFAHINQVTTDRPPLPPPPPEDPKPPYFSVNSIRRLPKIEDEDENLSDMKDPFGSRASVLATPASHTARESRANSMRSNMSHTNLPFGARAHRASWSSRDFSSWHEAGNRDSSGPVSRSGIQSMQSVRSDASLRDSYGVQPRSRAPSRGNTFPLEVMKTRGNGKEREREPVVMEKPSQDPVSPLDP